jgi:hypothetical protein
MNWLIENPDRSIASLKTFSRTQADDEIDYTDEFRDIVGEQDIDEPQAYNDQVC